jgi:hypothetical protein
MWAAASGGGGGGSIQDGDTEGQITTWSGDEWTPASDINVSSGILKLFDRGSGQGELRLYHEDDNTDFVVRGSPGSMGTFSISASDGGTADQRMTIDADGNVGINVDTPTASLEVVGYDMRLTGDSGSLYLEAGTNSYMTSTGSIYLRPGDQAVNGMIISSDGRVDITGSLFVNGVEVGGGGGGGLWTDNGDGSISYSGTVKATDVVATG